MGNLINIWNFIGRHKYMITILAYVVIVGFIDENSLLRRWGYQREIMQLNEEIEKYRAEYKESTEKLNELNNNPETLEKIAREKYLMKKPNEDIYVFEER